MPATVVGVKGTEFFMRVQEGQTFVSVFEGNIVAQNEAGELTLSSGQSAVAERGKAPVLRVVARPRDAVNGPCIILQSLMPGKLPLRWHSPGEKPCRRQSSFTCRVTCDKHLNACEACQLAIRIC